MKKAIALLLSAVLALGLAGCMGTADRSDNTKDGVIGDGLRDDVNDVKNGLDDMMDGDRTGGSGTANNGVTNGTTGGTVNNGTTGGTANRSANGTAGAANRTTGTTR